VTPEDSLAGIKDYRRLSDRIATAGQPSRQELAAVAENGYQVVINLHVSADLPDESDVVCSLGIEYVHIPVPWERPAREHLERFFEAMEARPAQRLFVHCAANKRVAAFMALYRIHRLGWPQEEALAFVDVPTFPPVWQAFIEEMLAASFEA
jgi:protein tyrosine phosphatase (PTP) superfamily phosphohydrolase (DUF442 family)